MTSCSSSSSSSSSSCCSCCSSSTGSCTSIPVHDIYLTSQERYEIWVVKSAERPELLETYNNHNNNICHHHHEDNNNNVGVDVDDSVDVVTTSCNHTPSIKNNNSNHNSTSSCTHHSNHDNEDNNHYNNESSKNTEIAVSRTNIISTTRMYCRNTNNEQRMDVTDNYNNNNDDDGSCVFKEDEQIDNNSKNDIDFLENTAIPFTFKKSNQQIYNNNNKEEKKLDSDDNNHVYHPQQHEIIVDDDEFEFDDDDINDEKNSCAYNDNHLNVLLPIEIYNSDYRQDDEQQQLSLLPISDGSDIPGWRQQKLVSCFHQKKEIQKQQQQPQAQPLQQYDNDDSLKKKKDDPKDYDDDDDSHNHHHMIIDNDDNDADEYKQIPFHIGSGCTLLRRESQLPVHISLKSKQHCKWEKVRNYIYQQQEQNNNNNINIQSKHNIIRIPYQYTNELGECETLPLHPWFERENIPVLIENCCIVDEWKMMSSCTFTNLVQRYGTNIPWRFSDTHSETMTLDTYAKYITSYEGAVTDDSPLAIYDSQFASPLPPLAPGQRSTFKDQGKTVDEKNTTTILEDEDDNDDDCTQQTTDPRQEILNEYTIPSCFRSDLYDCILDDTIRPPYRWILIGPERSGTGLHIDPVGTHAWVTLIEGCKKWILFPPTTSKRNIHMNGPTQIPSSIWFHDYYYYHNHNDHEQQQPPSSSSSRTSSYSSANPFMVHHPDAIEVIQYPGETIYVPAGWPHIVLNLQLSVAITQNYASIYPSGNIQDLFNTIITTGDDDDNGTNKKLYEQLESALQCHRPDLFSKTTT